jgi:hypothetical protein
MSDISAHSGLVLILGIALLMVAPSIGAVTDDGVGPVSISPDWRVETVDGTAGCGAYSSLLLDHDGRPHAAYTVSSSTGQSDLKYAWKSPAGWKTEYVDTSEDVLQEVSIAENNLGQPVIAYSYLYPDGVAGHYGLKYAVKVGGRWVSRKVVTGSYIGGDVALVIGKDGAMHLIYNGFEGKGLFHLVRQGGTWRRQAIDTSRGLGWPSAAIDGQGNIHVAYGHLSTDTRWDFRWAVKTESGWTSEVIARDNVGVFDGGIYIGLDVALAGAPSVSFTRPLADGSIMVAYGVRDAYGKWKILPVQTGYFAPYTAIALDVQDRPRITYLSLDRVTGETLEVRYALLESSTIDSEKPAWDISVAAKRADHGDVGDTTALKLLPSRIPWVTFIQNPTALPGNNHLMAATWA